MAAETMQEIAEFLKALKFQKKVFGGVSEADVWRNLEKLEKKYGAAFEAQKIKYEALLEERDKEIMRLKKKTGEVL